MSLNTKFGVFFKDPPTGMPNPFVTTNGVDKVYRVKGNAESFVFII